ncbi:hypothetical protein ACHAPT_013618 [Fusarium lateritium]
MASQDDAPSIAQASGETLSDLKETSIRCRALLHKLSAEDGPTNGVAAREQMASFKIWAANMGIFREGRQSLASRLKGAPEISELAHQLLVALERDLERQLLSTDCQEEISSNIESDDSSDRSSTSSYRLLQPTEDDEAASQPQPSVRTSVQNTITSLRQLALTVHRAGAHHRQVRIERFKGLERNKEVYETFERYAQRKVDHLFPNASETLRKRMAQSIATRRARFSYLEKHQKKISTLSEPAPTLQQNEVKVDEEFQVPSPVEQHQARKVVSPQNCYLDTNIDPSAILSNTIVTKLDLKRIEPTQDKRAESVTSVKISTGKFPSMPRLDTTGTSFTCPYCFLVHPAKEAGGETQWRNHLIHDFEPFFCVFDNCSSPFGCAETYTGWITHMREAHTQPQWHCWHCKSPTLSSGPFSNPGELEDHLTDHHGEEVPETFRPTLVKHSVLRDQHALQDCPFCGGFPEELEKSYPQRECTKAREALEKHVRDHLISVALILAPIETGELDEEYDDTKSEAQRDENSARDLDEVSLSHEMQCSNDTCDCRDQRKNSVSDWPTFEAVFESSVDISGDKLPASHIDPSRGPNTNFQDEWEFWYPLSLPPDCKPIGPAEYQDLAEDQKLMEYFRFQYLRFQTIHSVRCGSSRGEDRLYLGQPWVVESGPNNAHLRGSQAIDNFELYLERNKQIVFIVYKNYRCCGRSRSARSRSRPETDIEVDASTLLERERISIISSVLRSSLVHLANTALRGIPHPDFREDKDINHPYIWWFHRRTEIGEAMDKLRPVNAIHLFHDYILDRMMDEWETVDKLLEKSKISAQYMDYLFVPDHIVISKRQGNALAKLQGFVAQDWLETHTSNMTFSASIDVSSWSFDGRFRRTLEKLSIYELPSETDEFDIIDLPLYPIEFASDTVVKALRKRGQMFWKCRFRNYVLYATEEDDGIQNSVDSRYMVDTATHRRLHRDGNAQAERPPPGPNGLDSRYMSQDNPDLGDNFFMCLPMSIFGFNMDKKEWVNMNVHYIEDVVWNTKAFDFLVIKKEIKKLIQAVVTTQLCTREDADLIRGKGNGLCILLHGGPGTGKTLTAECVAEIAKKPLYRVTCEDIGTKVEEVEEYLRFVLHLGKTWGCVILLEQRSLVNLERNELVAVLLRVLEYHEDIVILTSNRVDSFDSFDKALKSRIQLVVRYEDLDWNQRLQIWKNFLTRLKRLELERVTSGNEGPEVLGYGIKVDEIKTKVNELANANLNGRQIRDAISRARQLAKYRKEPMTYEHLETAINKAWKFDEYLLELNNTFSADEIQRDKGER